MWGTYTFVHRPTVHPLSALPPLVNKAAIGVWFDLSPGLALEGGHDLSFGLRARRVQREGEPSQKNNRVMTKTAAPQGTVKGQSMLQVRLAILPPAVFH